MPPGEDLLSDFFLHHDDHFFGRRAYFSDTLYICVFCPCMCIAIFWIQEVKQYRTRDIVGDIRDHGIGIIWRSISEYIDMVDSDRSRPYESIIFSGDRRRDLISHISLIEDLDHIRIELDEIERCWMMPEYIGSERTVAWSDFDDVPTCDVDRPCYVCECFFVDEEVLSEGFFSFDLLHIFKQMS